VPQWVQYGPFALVYTFLLVVVFLRAQGTYWIGRAVAAGMLRTRWSRHFTSPRVTRAIGSIERWGWPIIPLSFLTIGFQSAVNAGAGVIRMRWLRYTLAMIPGCLVWALVYALGGLAAFRAAAALAARSPWALVAVIVLLGILVTVVVLRARRRRSEREPVEALAAQADHAAH
jgi:membrane protein DedA with SNARE-associated domain